MVYQEHLLYQKFVNIEMIGYTDGERYYWMVDKHKAVSMIPAFIVEKQQLTYEGKKQ